MWKPIAIITAVVAVLMAAIIFWLARDPSQVNEQRTDANPPAQTNEAVVGADSAEREPREAQAAAPKDFCERDFEQVAARESDAADLRETGGLVHIFEREARLDDPYGCADFYLAHGLDIDAADPRADHDQLTGLFYAIQRNDPKMLHFMIDHGADLEKRAGEKDTRAMGYAYFLALKDQRIDRNQVIGILDATLTRQAERRKNIAKAGNG